MAENHENHKLSMNAKCDKCGHEMEFFTWFCGVLFWQCKNKDCEHYCENVIIGRNDFFKPL